MPHIDVPDDASACDYFRNIIDQNTKPYKFGSTDFSYVPDQVIEDLVTVQNVTRILQHDKAYRKHPSTDLGELVVNTFKPPGPRKLIAATVSGKLLLTTIPSLIEKCYDDGIMVRHGQGPPPDKTLTLREITDHNSLSLISESEVRRVAILDAYELYQARFCVADLCWKRLNIDLSDYTIPIVFTDLDRIQNENHKAQVRWLHHDFQCVPRSSEDDDLTDHVVLTKVTDPDEIRLWKHFPKLQDKKTPTIHGATTQLSCSRTITT